MPHPSTWLKVLPQGLFCEPGGFFIDPVRPVDRAVITHAHSDHARPGHRAVLASPDTLALMTARLGEGQAGTEQQPLTWGETVLVGDVRVWLQPAGHVLGSAQVAMEYQGARAVVSGDYKRVPDPTCAGFIAVPCDVFVTEATFALPVFRHPPPAHEIGRLLESVSLFPERTHVVGCYALGKCQRLIALLRQAGWDGPLWLHGALAALCQVYEARGVELPLVISDHADWDELNATADEVGAPEIWVTHGREEALIHAMAQRGIKGRALRLLGYGDEDESDDTVEPQAAAK